MYDCFPKCVALEACHLVPASRIVFGFMCWFVFLCVYGDYYLVCVEVAHIQGVKEVLSTFLVLKVSSVYKTRVCGCLKVRSKLDGQEVCHVRGSKEKCV